jgi:hypothetical protein
MSIVRLRSTATVHGKPVSTIVAALAPTTVTTLTTRSGS